MSTSTCSSPDALLKCWKAVSPSPPTPHTMYCSMLRGSIGISHVLSSAHKHMKTYTLQTKHTVIIFTSYTLRESYIPYNVKLVNYPEQLSCYTHYLVLMNVVYSSFINTLTGREASCVDDTLLPSLSGSTHRDNVIGAAATEMVLVRACTATSSTLQGKGSKRLRDQTI